MNKYNPYDIIKSRHITEKATVLEGLKTASSNKSLSRCDKPKYVFIVKKTANKIEIAKAVESIYKEKNIKVKCVNTITVKPKSRRVRGFKGYTNTRKKAIVTLESGDSIDEIV